MTEAPATHRRQLRLSRALFEWGFLAFSSMSIFCLDYAKRNVRVNAVGPGPIETPLLAKGTGGDPHSYASFVPMGRIGQPDEIADAVVWLLSDEARFVTGHTLPVDGGVSSQ
jgi:NAD(P)-dependent dehydrogenase (short-subunit alcohol dehydrogenase family)